MNRNEERSLILDRIDNAELLTSAELDIKIAFREFKKDFFKLEWRNYKNAFQGNRDRFRDLLFVHTFDMFNKARFQANFIYHHDFLFDRLNC